MENKKKSSSVRFSFPRGAKIQPNYLNDISVDDVIEVTLLCKIKKISMNYYEDEGEKGFSADMINCAVARVGSNQPMISEIFIPPAVRPFLTNIEKKQESV